MNIFEVARTNVSARSAAEHYGLKVNRNGMACCPFHPDKHPSMKLDQRFHCFGCQADGDAVNLTAGLFGLGNYEAARKLLDDFGIEYSEEASLQSGKIAKRTGTEQEQFQQRQRLVRIENQFSSWLSYAEDTLLKYRHLLEFWKEKYRPTIEDQKWNPMFEEALQMQEINEYHLEVLFDGSDEERLEFFLQDREGVKRLAERISEYERSCTERIGA